MAIFVGQSLTITARDREGEDMSSFSLEALLFSPGNKTGTPDAVITDGILAAGDEVTIDIPSGTLDSPSINGSYWRLQLRDIDSLVPWTPIVINVCMLGDQSTG